MRQRLAAHPEWLTGVGFVSFRITAEVGPKPFASYRKAYVAKFGEDKIGPVLFHLSYDYVGDLAETLALIWEPDPDAGPPPTLAESMPSRRR